MKRDTNREQARHDYNLAYSLMSTGNYSGPEAAQLAHSRALAALDLTEQMQRAPVDGDD